MSRSAAILTTTVGLAVGGFAGGYIISHAATSGSSTGTGASTAASTGTTATSPSVTAPSPPAGSSSMPAHGTPAHENAETAVTGDNATKAQAAAVKYVGSGTAGAVTTDYTKTGYEVTVTKSDGSTVEVHLDSSFNVLQMPGPGGPGGPPPSGNGTAPAN
ncbi:MAG: hypothetical protein JOZ75_07910 [Candidatus Dormibacteraeota bacterium]|nr:hypothetical protein [Candidatus Dormibacteraeota bacterium]